MGDNGKMMGRSCRIAPRVTSHEKTPCIAAVGRRNQASAPLLNQKSFQHKTVFFSCVRKVPSGASEGDR